jgi:hypothetical protein
MMQISFNEFYLQQGEGVSGISKLRNILPFSLNEHNFKQPINNEVLQYSLLLNEINLLIYVYSNEWITSIFSFLRPDQGHGRENTRNPRKSIPSTSTQIELSMKTKRKNDEKVFPQMKMKRQILSHQEIHNT